MKSTIEFRKIEVAEIGFYLRLVRQEYGIKSNKQYAKLITEDFNIKCTEQDIENYERLHVEMEDYEKLSRMTEDNLEHLIE